MASASNETREGPVEACFSPHITVFASKDVQLKVCRKNNLPSFINLLRQFVYIDQVSFIFIMADQIPIVSTPTNPGMAGFLPINAERIILPDTSTEPNSASTPLVKPPDLGSKGNNATSSKFSKAFAPLVPLVTPPCRPAAFIESLRKHLKAVKMTDVATAFCVDLCKAATYSPKMKAEGHGLRLLALDLVSALNSRLLDASSPFTNADGMVEILLMSEALAALCKLDRHFVDTTLLEKCLSRNSFLSFKHGTAFCPSNKLKLQAEHSLGRHPPKSHLVHVRLFSRHYDYLTFMLAEVTKLEAVAVRSRKGKMASGGTLGGNGSTPEQAAALQQELSLITRVIVELTGFREQTMNCLVKLMAANMNPAFRHFVNMFHHPDTRIKQANIQILWEVIKEGGHLLPDLVKPVRASGLDKIVDMICRPDLTLALAMCKICGSADFEEMTEVILNIFDHRKGVIKFLKASIKREVAGTDHELAVFRGNSFTTQLLTIFARAQGYDYLRTTLSNLLVGLSNKPSEFSVNLYPHRASADDDEAGQNLEQVTEAFLNVIAVSWKKLPSAIREICHQIATTVQEKYPERVFTSIGGFIILRFINPAIVSPEVIDLDLPNDTHKICRSLFMITKVLQALSNNIRFSARERAMKPLNPFMSKNGYPMTRFLKDISSIDEHAAAEETPELNDEMAPVPLDAADQYVLHRFLYDNMEKLGAELRRARPTQFKHWHDGTEHLTPTLGQDVWNELHQALLDIAPPRRR
ncbi:hypothetical protein PCANC_12363 [Puccinia coronata f. sp. avenae]|uniref:Ras-GAP domain-containing protein n=1 Tax=Puccinia coronata f. sp. avenae TaxID=200324 RepID=A0A2N5V421_9BASI|nr:hypothetical protein PCANC_12363 [Puccinia coronata f. sp. avenae]